MVSSVRPAPSRFIVPLAGIATLVAVAFLRELAPDAYVILLKIMFKEPAPTPFADWEWIPSAIRCWADGVDVYVNMSCYRVWPNQVFNYSPLLLRATFLRSGEDWVNVTGLAIGISFFLSIALLPPPRTRLDVVFALVITLSSAGWLAVERGNADLIMFVTFAVALALLCRTGFVRFLAYHLLILAGLLKFYPFVALIIAVRERFIVLLLCALASCAALGLLVFTYHAELALMARNLPVPSIFTLQFGRENLPEGLGLTITKFLIVEMHNGSDEAKQIGAIASRAMSIIFVMASLAASVLFARRLDLPTALAKLEPTQANALLLGAALVAGCFYTVPNVIYRGLYLLFVLPGLGTLASEGNRRLWNGTRLLMGLVLWEPFFEAVLYVLSLASRSPYQADPLRYFPDRPVGYVFWMMTEVGWWWIAIVLTAVVGSSVARSEAWLTLGGIVGRGKRRPRLVQSGAGAFRRRMT